MKRLAFVLVTLTACTDSKPNPAQAQAEPAPASPASAAEPAQAEAAKAEPTKAEPTKAEPTKAEPTDPSASDEPAPELEAPAEPAPVVAGEVGIQPWTIVPHTRSWRLAAEPSDALAFVDLGAGILGRAGSTWYQLGEDGKLAVVSLDREPTTAVLGTWPTDAWFVEDRIADEGEEGMEYIELRLMKLRGGNRWVPQEYTGRQWFHPGTDHEDAPHMSVRSGMLMYSDEFESITRVAGQHPDPEIGEHRGQVVDFLEAGSGAIYVLSYDAGRYYAQIECAEPSCVDTNAKRLPLDDWKFDRRVARGRHSVSVQATSGTREFILHQRGKSDGWLLDELPAGEAPSGMWASEEGGLWTLTGQHLRWRDTESVWYEVALPEGLSAPSLALSGDRKEVWIAGQVGGATKVFATTANAEPVAAPTP